MNARGHSLFLPQEQIQISHRTASWRKERISFLWKRPLSHWRPFLPRGVFVSTLSSMRRAVSGLKPSRHTGSWTTVSPFCSSFPACLRSSRWIIRLEWITRNLQTLLITCCTCENFVNEWRISGYLALLFTDCFCIRVYNLIAIQIRLNTERDYKSMCIYMCEERSGCRSTTCQCNLTNLLNVSR